VQLGNKLDLATAIEKITVAPRRRLGLEVPKIEEGEMANLTLFDPREKWVLDDRTNASRSKNSPFYGKELVGKPLAVFNKGRYMIDYNMLRVS